MDLIESLTQSLPERYQRRLETAEVAVKSSITAIQRTHNVTESLISGWKKVLIRDADHRGCKGVATSGL